MIFGPFSLPFLQCPVAWSWERIVHGVVKEQERMLCHLNVKFGVHMLKFLNLKQTNCNFPWGGGGGSKRNKLFSEIQVSRLSSLLI